MKANGKRTQRLLTSANRYSVKLAASPGTCVQKGKKAEHEVARILRDLGFCPVTLEPHPSPFDIRCCGTRIEVKYASLCYASRLSVSNHWAFNIHRHGKVDESQVDVYVLVCGGNRIANCQYMLVMPAPLQVKTFTVSLRSLRGEYARYLNRWELIYRSRDGREQLKREAV